MSVVAVSGDSSCARAAFSETTLLFRCWMDWHPVEQASSSVNIRRMAGILGCGVMRITVTMVIVAAAASTG